MKSAPLRHISKGATISTFEHPPSLSQTPSLAPRMFASRVNLCNRVERVKRIVARRGLSDKTARVRERSHIGAIDRLKRPERYPIST